MPTGQSEPPPRSVLLRMIDDADVGSDRAVEELVRHCWAGVHRYLQRRGAETAEALTNQVLAEFVLSLPRLSFSSDRQVWAYLHRIARSRLIDERRKQRAEHLPLDEEDIGAQAADLFEDRLAQRLALVDLLTYLTLEQRQVLEMRFYLDLSVEETATRMGKSISAIKGLQHRAMAALNEQQQRDEADEATPKTSAEDRENERRPDGTA